MKMMGRQIGITKFEIKLFDGKNNFVLWQSTIKDVLTTYGLDIVVEETKPEQLKDVDWNLI